MVRLGIIALLLLEACRLILHGLWHYRIRICGCRRLSCTGVLRNRILCICGSLRHDSLCCSELLGAASGRSLCRSLCCSELLGAASGRSLRCSLGCRELLWAANGEGLLCQLLCAANGAGLLCRSLRPSSLCCSELLSAASGAGLLCRSLRREGCYRGEGTC